MQNKYKGEKSIPQAVKDVWLEKANIIETLYERLVTAATVKTHVKNERKIKKLI